MAQAVEEFEKSLLEELECPACLSYMCAPIRQCLEGHSICDQCFSNLETCPKCRSPKSQARSYCLEVVHSKLHIPCRHANVGCNFVSLGKKIRHHETNCKLAVNFCPLRKYDNCQWKDVASELKAHLKEKHADHSCIKYYGKFTCIHFGKTKGYDYAYIVLYAYKNVFRMTFDIDEVTGMTRWVVYYMGCNKRAKRYSYKIEFKQKSRSISFILKSPCEAMPHDKVCKFLGNNYFHLHRNSLTDYFNYNGDLNFKVAIYKKSSKYRVSHVNNLLNDLSIAEAE